MPGESSSNVTPANATAVSRLQSIANHMAPTTVTTSFPAEAVPQAPEDPLFGLMRAYRADESNDKVDLVSHCRR
jgi:aspartate aminotransferase, cytoplasmic